MHPPVPFIRILYEMMGRLNDVDLATRVDLPDLKLRWARNRYTSREERPCLALAFVSDEPADEGRFATNPGESVRIMGVDMILDMEVETESSAEANEAMQTPIDEFDPTGLSMLAGVLYEADAVLRECCDDPLRDTTALGRMVDWIQEVSVDEDEELPDDDGRLVGRVNVIYRVHSVDPRILLERPAP